MPSYRYLLLDDITGKFKRGGTVGQISVADQDFDVGFGGQQNFDLSTPFLEDTILDVEVNGIKVREGALNDWVRNVSLNRIEFNAIINQYGWISTRLFTNINPGEQDYDVGSGGQQNFDVAIPFTPVTAIDIFVNGVKTREGALNDWIRNVSLNRIEFNYVVLEPAWVNIRLFT